ncbi:MAG: hypothetical protein FJW14_03390 [Acidimicrobiia bacterium]|nr:hypothetical protein [Acidimicrobiia bacterium]
MTRTVERAAAIFLVRSMLGFVYLFAGIQRIPNGTPFDYAVAVLEIGLGGLLLAGFWSRRALRCLALLIVGITLYYGIDGLRNPMGVTAMNIMVVNFYILPRAALIIVNLFLPAEDDLLSVDAIVDGRVRRLSRGAQAAARTPSESV